MYVTVLQGLLITGTQVQRSRILLLTMRLSPQSEGMRPSLAMSIIKVLQIVLAPRFREQQITSATP